MQAHEFVEHLKEVMPTKELLLNSGDTSEDADEFRNSYACKPRSSLLKFETYGDATLELIKGWDTTRLEIGQFCFHDKPIVVNGKIEIGVFEVDPVVYRLATRDYVMFDHDIPGYKRLMCHVAPNGDTLLDALLIIADFYAKTSTGEIDYQDENACLEAKNRCLKILGEEKHDGFCELFF